MLSRNENADKRTCTENLQTKLTSLSKIQQETGIVRRLLEPDCSSGFSNTPCLSLSGFVRKPSHSQFLVALRKMQGHLTH